MVTGDFFPVKVDMISVDVVNNPRDCSGLVFWTNIKLVKEASDYTNVRIKNYF